MKTPVIALVLALNAVIGATESDAQENELDGLLHWRSCQMLGGIAESVMSERQNNTPMSTMMQRVQSSMAFISFDGLPIDEAGLAGIVFLAYDQPRFRSDELQQDSIEEFRNEIEILCYRNELLGE